MSKPTTTSYYDLKITRMDTATPFEEVWTGDGRGNAWAPDHYSIDDPEDGRRYQLRGLHQGPPLSRGDLVAMCYEYHYAGNERSAIIASVTDNGENGDGLMLTFTPGAREGNAETHPDRWCRREPMPLFGIELRPDEARVLGEALLAAARLRSAQASEADRA